MIGVLTIFLCVLHFTSVTSKYADCKTGSECIKISECDELFHMVKNLTSENAGLLRSRHCGFDNAIPKVCCFPNNFQSRLLDDNCGGNESGNLISENKKFPWLAILKYKTNSGSNIGCGGALISDRYVLTSADCLDESYNLSSVVLGQYDATGRPKSEKLKKYDIIEVLIEETIIHEDYNDLHGAFGFKTKAYDIGLIRLKSSIREYNFQPICLPSNGESANEKFISAGWGTNPRDARKGEIFRSNKKAMAKLTKLDRQDCENKYDGLVFDMTLDDRICTIAESAGLNCVGDYGGPLMSFDEQGRAMIVGIFSPIRVCTEEDLPGTYTDVRQYKDWIIAHMRD